MCQILMDKSIKLTCKASTKWMWKLLSVLLNIFSKFKTIPFKCPKRTCCFGETYQTDSGIYIVY